jgi:hypothetical protein
MKGKTSSDSVTVSCHGGCGRTMTAPAKKLEQVKYFICNDPSTVRKCMASLPPCPDGKYRHFNSVLSREFDSVFLFVFEEFPNSNKSEEETFTKNPENKSDATYSIDCTRDCRVGDDIRFMQAQFSGGYPKARFLGYKAESGKIVSVSYNPTNKQHIIGVLLENGKKTRVKGDNFFKDKIFRKPWADESERNSAEIIKVSQGDAAYPALSFAGLDPDETHRLALSNLNDGRNWDGTSKKDGLNWSFEPKPDVE